MWQVLVGPKLCPGLEPSAGATSNTVLLKLVNSDIHLSSLLPYNRPEHTLPLQVESILESAPSQGSV